MPALKSGAIGDVQRAAQHESWTRDRHRRRRGVTFGNVRSHLREYPGDLPALIAVVASAVADDQAAVTP